MGGYILEYGPRRTAAAFPENFHMTIKLLLGLSAALIAGATRAQTAPVPEVRILNLADRFAEVWDRHSASPQEDFIQEFRSTIEPEFAVFYGVDRYSGKKTRADRDQDIARAFSEFGTIRSTYLAKARAFADELPVHLATFKRVFPTYQPSQIYFIHSLGEMDGGKRKLDGRSYFIFGADVMAKYHGKGSEAAFFHHELFHDYQPVSCSGNQVWTYLWAEGLASYVAKTLNPDASEEEMLLHVPENMVANTRAHGRQAWEDLESRLEHGLGESYSGLFMRSGDKSGLPARRGYYLGYLVARDMGKTYSLPQLAALDCDTVRKEIFATVKRLKDQPMAE